jgi:hypothetical protein
MEKMPVPGRVANIALPYSTRTILQPSQPSQFRRVRRRRFVVDIDNNGDPAAKLPS